MGVRAGIGRDVLKRRGLLAGAAALVAGGLARLAGTERAQAAHDTGGSPEALHAGVTNTVAGQTTIYTTAGQALLCDGTNRGITGVTSDTSGVRIGVVGTNTSSSQPNESCGVLGNAAVGNGVLGNTSNGFGVKGVSGSEGPSPNTTAGVWGTSSNTNGVIGTSTQSSGVIGIAGGPGPGLGAAYGVVGTSVANVGVVGTSTNNFGVRGLSTNNVGVYAESVSNTGAFAAGARGVWGRTTNGIGVLAQATQGGTAQNRSYGIYAAAPGPGWAGYFEGNVYVTGSVFTPGGALSMAQAADGSQRTLYSQDSTEPVVEDFGEAKLAEGRFEVKLDPDFAAVADGTAYQVFLTPYAAWLPTSAPSLRNLIT